MEKAMLPFQQFESTMCQKADLSHVSRGCFSPDGKYFATAGWSGKARVWSVPDCKLSLELFGHLGRVTDVQFNPIQNQSIFVASSSEDNTIRL